MTVPLPLLIDHVRAAASMETGATGAIAAEGVRQLEAMRFALAADALESVITAHENGTAPGPGIRLWRGLHARLRKAINFVWAHELVGGVHFDPGCRGTVITGAVAVLVGIDALGVLVSDDVPFEWADGEVKLHHLKAKRLPDAIGPTHNAPGTLREITQARWWEPIAAAMNRRVGHGMRLGWAEHQATIDVRGARFQVEAVDPHDHVINVEGDLIIGTVSTPLVLTLKRTAFGIEVPLAGVAQAMAGHYDAGLVDGDAVTRIANYLRNLVRGG